MKSFTVPILITPYIVTEFHHTFTWSNITHLENPLKSSHKFDKVATLCYPHPEVA